MSAVRCQRDFVPYVMENSSALAAKARRRRSRFISNMAISPRIELDAGPIRDIISMTDMSRRRPVPDDSKAAALRAAGALHPHPERITDALFAQSPFFDRRDRVQVKYEMLRAHDVDGRQISKVARTFGTSRQAVYAAAAAFRAQGIPGLLPQPRGPKRAHKCTDEILDFAAQWRTGEPPDAESITDAIRRRFGISIHPRSLQRALARRAKKGRQKGAGRA
jgi:transposase